MFPLNNKFLRLSCFEKIRGTGRTDGRRERETGGRGATLNAAVYREGRELNITYNYKLNKWLIQFYA